VFKAIGLALALVGVLLIGKPPMKHRWFHTRKLRHVWSGVAAFRGTKYAETSPDSPAAPAHKWRRLLARPADAAVSPMSDGGASDAVPQRHGDIVLRGGDTGGGGGGSGGGGGGGDGDGDGDDEAKFIPGASLPPPPAPTAPHGDAVVALRQEHSVRVVPLDRAVDGV
jgi:hypothetical protein